MSEEATLRTYSDAQTEAFEALGRIGDVKEEGAEVQASEEAEGDLQDERGDRGGEGVREEVPGERTEAGEERVERDTPKVPEDAKDEEPEEHREESRPVTEHDFDSDIKRAEQLIQELQSQVGEDYRYEEQESTPTRKRSEPRADRRFDGDHDVADEPAGDQQKIWDEIRALREEIVSQKAKEEEERIYNEIKGKVDSTKASFPQVFGKDSLVSDLAEDLLATEMHRANSAGEPLEIAVARVAKRVMDMERKRTAMYVNRKLEQKTQRTTKRSSISNSTAKTKSRQMGADDLVNGNVRRAAEAFLRQQGT